MAEILDCTLRDGGYYTDWDFAEDITRTYVSAVNKLPVDYIEVGYRSLPGSSYLGKYAYCPVYELKKIRENCGKKIAVMLNEKDVKPEHLPALLEPVKGCVDMVRLAVNPASLMRAVELARAVKGYGFEVSMNMMYMSKWGEFDGFYENLTLLDGVVDILCMVDSFGGVSPDEVSEIYSRVRGCVSCKIGFHGHNNLQMGLVNTYTAIMAGVDVVDATVLGMGRGAGNLNLELLLTYLNKKQGLNVDFNILGDLVSAFEPLHRLHNWGTNLPYMLAGANSFPQKEVMAWVTNRRCSFNSIVRALNNRLGNVEDNAKFPMLDVPHVDNVLIVGGGDSVVAHIEGIKEFVRSVGNVAIVHASTRNAACFVGIDAPQYFCLTGDETTRMKSVISADDYNGVCVLPPYPRKMGTEVPEYASESTYELQALSFSDDFKDSCTAVALETAVQMSADRVYIVGYDGYKADAASEKAHDLSSENSALFAEYIKSGGELFSITPTLYKELKSVSLYQNM